MICFHSSWRGWDNKDNNEWSFTKHVRWKRDVSPGGLFWISFSRWHNRSLNCVRWCQLENLSLWEGSSVLTSSSWLDCSAADRTGLVSWVVSTGLWWINHISGVVVLGLSVYCLTVNFTGQYGYISQSAPTRRTPMIQGWGDKEATAKQKQMGRTTRMTEWTFMVGNRYIAHSFCNEN